MAIAVDAMGGDTPIAVKVKAAVEAVNDFDIEVVLVGSEKEIIKVLKVYEFDNQKLRIVNSTEIVEMDESPAISLRQKKIHQLGLP